MFSHYIKIALRSLLKFKAYASINLIGLALGLTAGVLIILYVQDELSFDRFHSKADRIYRIETQFVSNGQDESSASSLDANAWPVGAVLRKEFPEVEGVLYARNASFLLVNYQDRKIKQNIHFASPEFFQMFSFPLLKGNPTNALSEPFSVVITEEMEKKYFDGDDALNKTITVADTLTLLVTGVASNTPANSHIQFDMLVSFSTFEKINRSFSYDDGWGNINMRNYVLLKQGTNAKSFINKAKSIYMERVPGQMKDWGVSAYLLFQPLSNLYLTSRAGNGWGPVGSIDRVYLLVGIAVFIIILACINFINLTTARSVYRAKEVGLRKVVGSSRFTLIKQFIGESFVLTSLALLLATALTGLLLPVFNNLLGKSYALSALLKPQIAGAIAALTVVVTILSGYYPAVVLSSMKPNEVLKGKFQNNSKGVALRRALVVFQFVVSVALVLGALLVIEQLSFMQKQDLGFAKNQVLVINAARVQSPNPDGFQTFKNQIKELASVQQVSFANTVPGNPGWIGQVAYPEGRSGDNAVSVEYMAVDDAYIETLGLKLLAGRAFSVDREAELKDGLILNETAVSQFGWASPEDAIGKKITSPSGDPSGEVIGVVKDYHQFGLQQNIGPMVMDYSPERSYLYAIRYTAADTQLLLSQLEQLWKKSFTGFDFNYFFLDQDFERQYQGEQRLAKVFGLFAAIAIVIAIIGLLGLVSFMVVSRTKEIGVRKVLGANVLSITSLLSREFVVLVIIANIIAFPLTWYFAEQWLQGFANRVEINPIIFVLTFVMAMVATFITVSFQTIKAALADPVDSLRYE